MEKTYRIKYRRTTVTVQADKPTMCQVCGKAFKKMNYHHTKYAYPTKLVKENPQLALDNTIVCCFHCHKIANCLRIIDEFKDKAIKIRILMNKRTLEKIEGGKIICQK